MSAISLLTLDLDNTLWDVESIIVKADEDMHAWLGQHYPASQALGVSGFQAIRQQVIAERKDIAHDFTAMRLTMLEQLLLATGYDEDQSRTGAAGAFDVFYTGRNRVVLFDGVADTLDQLSQRFPLFALSNGNADITKMPIAPYFRANFSAESVGAAKPDPAPFLAALRYAGVSPNGAVHVGDHPEQDVAAAQAVGMRAIWFNPQHAKWPLAGKPDAQVHALADLAEAITSLN